MAATTKFSNFSIDHILGSGFGPTPHAPAPMHTVGYMPDGYFHGLPRDLGCLDYGDVGRVSVYRPTPYYGMDFAFGRASYPTHGTYGLHHGFSLYPNSVHSRPAGLTERRPLASLDNCKQQQHHSASERPQPHPTSRMRTVFTDSQTKHLDKLFEVTDYPGVESRAELARNTGLTEETVRVGT